MSASIRRALRSVMPHGIVEWRRVALYARGLRKYGIEGSAASIAVNAEAARFDLWPEDLRRRPAAWTLVDVGANEGEFLRAVRCLVAPPRVVAVEPLDECQQRLRERVAEYPSAEVVQVILDEAPGSRDILRMRNSKFSSVLQPAGGIAGAYAGSDSEVVERVSTKCDTLDNVARSERDIGLLKIDVQGFEASVLRGARETLGRTRAVLIEINYVQHYQEAAGTREVFDLLHEHGFRLHGVSCPYRGPAGPLWADAMFAKD